jgi:DNA repair exonuclease SbcCD ATPase subunit
MNSQHLHEINTLREENAAFENELVAVKARYNDTQAQVQNNTLAVSTRDTEIAELNKKLAKVMGHHNPKQRIHHVEKLKQELSDSKRDRQKLESELQKYKSMSIQGGSKSVMTRRPTLCSDKENRR